MSEPNPMFAFSEAANEQVQPMRALLEGSDIPEPIWKDLSVFAPDESGSLSAAEIQEFLDGITYPAEPSDLLVKARIRLLWRKCQKSGATLQPDPPQTTPMGSTGAMAEQASWSEAFPKRLSGDTVRQMVKSFSPSPRLLSLVHQQLQDKRWRWIPWKLRLSEEQYDSKSLERSLKAPRLENLLWEEIPSRELPTQGMAKSVMAELLHLQAVAIALADGAHLYTLREMNRKFLAKCFDHLPRDAGLRVPNRLEAETAEKQLWQQISVLFNEENWTMDQAIREVVVARNELHVLLMPRAVAPKIPWLPWQPRRIKGDGKQGSHGKGGKGDKGSKGGTKDGKGSQRHTLMVHGLRVGTSWMDGKNRRLLCSGFQQGKCNRDQCKFEHAGCMSQPLESPQSGVVLADADMSVIRAAEACEPMHTGHTVCFEPQSDAEESNLPLSGFPPCDSSGSALATFSEVPPVPAAVDAPSSVSNAACAAVADPSSAVSDACDTILHILQSVDWPSCHTARAVLQPCDNDGTGYWNFGVRPSEPAVLTSITQDKPDVVRRLNALFKVLWPDQVWNSICINLNRAASLHQDLANSEGSLNLNVSVGDFQGGALWLESATGTLWRQPPGSQHWIKGEEVQTFRNPVTFPACAWHETMPFVGNRWSITCYTLPHVPEGTLAKLGFPEVSPAQLPPASPTQESAATSAVNSTAPMSVLPPEEDLRDDRIFDGLLKLAHSGAVAFAHASPPCSDYSIVKRFDGGPAPCRSWECLGGFPSNNAEAQGRVQSSHLLLSRAVMILHAVFQSGNHVSLEQPRNSMAWAEPVTQAWLLEIEADVIQVAACSYGSNYAKHWAFATSWRPLQQLQSACRHAAGHHDVFHGKRDATGQFVSRYTAVFPPMLCNAFMEAISPLFPVNTKATGFTSLHQALSALPVRPLNDFPTGQQDGGGIYSQPDWTSPPAGGQTFAKPDASAPVRSLHQARDLQTLIGLLHWVLQMSPELLPWLCCLYHDMSRPLGTNFSLHAGAWQQLADTLTDDLHFRKSPPGSTIPPGSKLLSARHVEIKCKADLRLVRATGKRIWIRVADASSSKRRISTVSRQFIMFWVHFCMRPQMPRCLFQYSLAADACAKGNDIGIGGWVELPNQPIVWFSEWFTVQDFRSLGLPMKDDANLDITAYETLAQLALLIAFISITPTGRLRVCIPSWSDNTGTESLTNKLFTVHTPLCFFAQKLATRSWQSGISLDCTHIAGCHDDSSDFLSRWKGDLKELPSRFHSDHRVRCPLTVLWEGERDVRVFPQDAKLLWQPPVSSFSEQSV
ncbi:unnamed protein product [Symbiodinium sp. CCMP2592]|nr:unnamed protein product [Symbiodinium sp. CCMP2592]